MDDLEEIMKRRSLMFTPAVPGSRYVLLDTETAGFGLDDDPERTDSGEILQLALADWESGEVLRWLFRPNSPPTKAALEFCHMQDMDLRALPSFVECQTEICEKLDGVIAIAHNAAFDIRVLRTALGEAFDLPPFIDSMELALIVLPHLQGHSVDALAAYYSDRLSLPEMERHTAAGDVMHERAIAQLLLEDWIEFPDTVRRAILECIPPAMELRTLLQSTVATECAVPKDLRLLFPEHLTIEPTPAVLDEIPVTVLLEENIIKSDFAAGGIVGNIRGDGYRPRSGQIRMASIAAGTLASGSSVAVEAGTGTGKSWAYSIPAIRYSLAGGTPTAWTRLVVATHTKALQEQLGEDLARICAPMGATFAVIKGRRNYVDLNLLDRQYRETIRKGRHPHQLDDLVVAMLVAWVCRPAQPEPERSDFLGDLDSVSFWARRAYGSALRSATANVTDRLTLVRQEIDGKQKQTPEKAFPSPFEHALARARKAQIIVVNHALWFASTRVRVLAYNVVFDEAHELEGVVTDALTLELSLIECRSWLGRTRGFQVGATNQGHAVRDAARHGHSCVTALFCEVESLLTSLAGAETERPREVRLPVKLPLLLTAAAEAAQDAFARLTQAIEQLVLAGSTDNDFHLQSIIEDGRVLAGKVEQLLGAPALAHVVRTVSDDVDDENGLVLTERLVSVADHLRERFWKAPLRCRIYTSATLTTSPGEFDFWASRLGLDEIATESVESPFDYGNQMRIIVAQYATAPSVLYQERYEDDIARLISSVALTIGGRTLGLFTSREMLGTAAPLIARLSTLSTIAQIPSESVARLVETFRRLHPAILLGVASVWQGVDLPGEALQGVVLAKLPFPAMDPLSAARAQAVEKLGKRAFDDYTIPRAVLRFKQGVGRLIRTESDSGVIVIADSRVRLAYYGQAFLSALPVPIDDIIQIGHTLEETCRLAGDFLRRPTLLCEERPVPVRPVRRAKSAEDRVTEIERFLAEPYSTLAGKTFKPFQRKALIALDEGRDVFLAVPTGSGKSLVFQADALASPRGVTIVVEPTQAIIEEQTRALSDWNSSAYTRVASWTGAIAQGERHNILRSLRGDELALLYVTPEALASDLLFRALKGVEIRTLVIDEAHCVLTWGDEFRHAYARLPSIISSLRENRSRPRMLCATGSLSLDERQELSRLLGMTEPELITKSVIREEIALYVKSVAARADQFAKLRPTLAERPRETRAIVFCRTRALAASVACFLRLSSDGEPGLRVALYHAGLPSNTRRCIIDQIQADGFDVIVATGALGMGVNIERVSLVIHVDAPYTLEDYCQQIGRAIRIRVDTETRATAVLLATQKEIDRLRKPVKPGLMTPKLREVLDRGDAVRLILGDTEEEEDASELELQLARAERISAIRQLGALPTTIDVWRQPGVSVEQLRDFARQPVEHRLVELIEAGGGRATVRPFEDLGLKDSEIATFLDYLAAARDNLELAVDMRCSERAVVVQRIGASNYRLRRDIVETPWRRKKRRQEGLLDYLTAKDCRRTVLSGYFGIEAPRSNGSEKCCDNDASFAVKFPWEVARYSALAYSNEYLTIDAAGLVRESRVYARDADADTLVRYLSEGVLPAGWPQTHAGRLGHLGRYAVQGLVADD